jgi:hypothetical protein
VAVDDVKFQAMLRQAREFHKRVDELDSASGSVIVANVFTRLNGKPQPPELPPGQSRLADEILALLENPRLSPMQAHALALVIRGE